MCDSDWHVYPERGRAAAANHFLFFCCRPFRKGQKMRRFPQVKLRKRHYQARRIIVNATLCAWENIKPPIVLKNRPGIRLRQPAVAARDLQVDWGPNTILSQMSLTEFSGEQQPELRIRLYPNPRRLLMEPIGRLYSWIAPVTSVMLVDVMSREAVCILQHMVIS